MFTSLVKVGVFAGISLSFLLNLDGIFGSSTAGSLSLVGALGGGVLAAGCVLSGSALAGSVGASGGKFFFLGLATVSDESDPGPSCAKAKWNEIAPNAITTAAAKPALKYFIQSPLRHGRHSPPPTQSILDLLIELRAN